MLAMADASDAILGRQKRNRSLRSVCGGGGVESGK
jgi:hypothetical protein